MDPYSTSRLSSPARRITEVESYIRAGEWTGWRLKQWLAMLTRNYPEAVVLFNAMRRETDCEKVRHMVNNPPVDVA